MRTRITRIRPPRPGPHIGIEARHRTGAALLAIALAAGLAFATPAQAGRLDEAATRICTAQGLKPGTAAFDRCYREQLIILSGKAADSIHGSP